VYAVCIPFAIPISGRSFAWHGKTDFLKSIETMEGKGHMMSETDERNRKIIDEFRTNHGKVGGRFEGKTLLLLHTKGAKSGQERINPVAYVRDGNRYVVIASKGGAPTNPDWYYNVLQNPLVTIEVGTEKLQAHAKVSEEPERSRLYDKMVEMMPAFDDYRRKASRIIPVIILIPIN
jgi:deazaflavin-dependent oxidoreductase (nitroreductase family)